ncbi:hypothetical protein K438DRAFT_1763384 [Mycena galopus ATCC 62051]|nr:hypothetical protein K438DRAFT_1763384 [Mycena galopus ATCC 62051]
MAGRPHIVQELDFAGMIVDANGTQLKNGDLVFGARDGAMAEYVNIPPGCGRESQSARATDSVHQRRELQRSPVCDLIAKFTASVQNRELLLSLGVDETTKVPPWLNNFANALGPNYTPCSTPWGSRTPPCTDTERITWSSMASTSGWAGSLLWAIGRPGSAGDHANSPQQNGDVSGRLDVLRRCYSPDAVRPIEDSVHSFDRAGVMAAYEKLITNHAVGKMLLEDTLWSTEVMSRTARQCERKNLHMEVELRPVLG